MKKLASVALFVFLFAAVSGLAATQAGPPYIPIAEARQQAQGTVTVLGLVTVPSGDFRSSSEDEGFAVQDQTGGIWVSLQKNLGLRVGQRVEVTGTLGQGSGKLQITADPAAVKKLPGTALRIATGHVGTATLGFLITVEGKVAKPIVEDLPDGYKVYIDDGTGEAMVYLNKSTDIDPKSPLFRVGSGIRVTGFGNQYNTSYEVDPRSRRDIQAAP
jgi:DNA/RNA endonuclease YhcR with UshA esterase domain